MKVKISSIVGVVVICLPLINQSLAQTTVTLPDCVSADSDVDGDGFGWENEQSCLVVGGQAQQAQIGQCIDSDGDGFGWNGVATCDPSSSALDDFITGALVGAWSCNNQVMRPSTDAPSAASVAGCRLDAQSGSTCSISWLDEVRNSSVGVGTLLGGQYWLDLDTDGTGTRSTLLRDPSVSEQVAVIPFEATDVDWNFRDSSLFFDNDEPITQVAFQNDDGTRYVILYNSDTSRDRCSRR